MVHQLLQSLAGVLGSVPAAIVLATVVLRAALLPLSLRGYRAEGVRARLAPQLDQLRRTHAEEPAELLRRQAELLRAAGSGPFAGLLPALAQAPFMWLLYREFTAGTMHGHTLLGADLTDRLVAHPALLAGWLIVTALAVVAVANVWQLPPGTPVLLRAMSFGTVLFAPFVPVAAGIYLVTTAVWTAVERAVGRRLLVTPHRTPAPESG